MKNSVTALLIFFTTLFPNLINAQCENITLGCESVNLSINSNCQANITADLIVTNDLTIEPLASCASMLKVAVFDINEDLLSNGEGASVVIDANNPLTGYGETISAQVFWDLNDNNKMDNGEGRCWGNILVEDKVEPTFPTACPDVTVYCYQDFSATSTSITPPPTAVDNCSGTISSDNYTSEDEVDLNDCHTEDGPYETKAIITRTHTATDDFGTSGTCVQTITVLRIPINENNVLPPVSAIVECNNTEGIDSSAASIGYPRAVVVIGETPDTVELSPANLGTYCSDVIVSYKDSPLNVNGCVNQLKEKILREFTVLECCTDNVIKVFQSILIKDTTAPSITCPSDITINSSTNSCNGNAFLPAATVSDDCSIVSVRVTNASGDILLSTNGGAISNLPLGTSTLTYTATDECGNDESCTMNVTVADQILPTAICEANTIVGLNDQGFVSVNADVFDNGSYDNCGPIRFEARRMTDNCGIANNLTFQPYITVCCADIGSTIMVEMRVLDAADNATSCMVELEVQDKLDPTIICPSDKTISCGSDFNDMALVGEAIGSDNCGEVTITHSDEGSIDPMCGTGVITRTWTATDAAGRTTSCEQIITSENPNPFTGDTNSDDDDHIEWPADVMNENSISCADYLANMTVADAENTGEPIVTGDEDGCDMVLPPQSEDLNLINNGEGKILRTWTVIDWCQHDPNDASSGGIWTHVQTIVVGNDNTIPPVFTDLPPETTVEPITEGCATTVTIPTIGIENGDDCSSGVTVAISGDLGTSIGDVENVGPGTYTVIYTATNAAGLSTSYDIEITVIDTEDPQIELNGCPKITVPLMPEVNELTLAAKSFLDQNKVTDNCTSFEDLKVTVRFFDMPEAVPPTEDSITFNCSNVGEEKVLLWICDETPNCFPCVATVTIQDNAGSCPLNLTVANITGTIEDESGDGIEEVELLVNDEQMCMTGTNGNFIVENLPLNETYVFAPEKNTDPRNGVTTIDVVNIKKHILGNEFLDSPYKIIAADVNGSGHITTFDLLLIRNLILMNIEEFPNDMPSWRFVDADYEFPDPTDPFATVFPEEYEVQDLAEDMVNMNFVSVKLGDVNSSAIPALTTTDTRNRVGEMTFTTEDQWIQKGETSRFRISSEAIEDLEAWQFSLTFETQYLEILEIEKKENVHIGSSLLENGVLTALWDKDVNEMLQKNPYWLDIQFLAKENVHLSDAIQLNSDFTKAEAYNNKGDLYDATLRFEPINSISQKGNELILYQNTPNPFSEETTITFYIPEADDVSLKIYNTSGKLVKRIDRNFEAGHHQLLISSKDLPSTGMMYYRLETSKDHATQRMFLLKK